MSENQDREDAGKLAALRISYHRLAESCDRLRLQVAQLERERVLLTRRIQALEEEKIMLGGVVPDHLRPDAGEMWPDLSGQPDDAGLLEPAHLSADRYEIPTPARITAQPKRLGRCEICDFPTFGTRCSSHLLSDRPQEADIEGQEGTPGSGKG